MPTISSASVRLATTATDTVAPSTISTPLLVLPVGRSCHHGSTLGGPSHPRSARVGWPCQCDDGGGRGGDQQGQADRPVHVVGGGKRAVAEDRPVLGSVAVVVPAAQPDPEGAGEGGLHASGVGARMRGTVAPQRPPG